MTDTFRGIITADGKKRQLPYGSILDKPVSDETLSIQGGFADSKAVGDKFKETKAETDSLKGDLGDIDENLGKSTVYGRNAIDSSKYDGLILTDELVGELTNNPPVFEIHNAFEIGQNSVATNLFFQDGTRVEGVRGLRVNYYDENGEIITYYQLGSNSYAPYYVNGAKSVEIQYFNKLIGTEYIGKTIKGFSFTLAIDSESYHPFIESFDFLRIQRLENKLGDLDNNPDIDIRLIANAKRGYNNWSNHKVSKVLSFCVFTDIHGDSENLTRYINFCKKYNSNIDAMLCLGDMVSLKFGDDFDYWLGTDGAENILCTLGNHDVWLTGSGGGKADKIQVYNKYFVNIGLWNVAQPPNAQTNGLMYYYKDYTNYSIRLVVLDCMYWDTNEKNWFNEVLSSAIQNNYHVIVTTHFNPTRALSIIDNCNFYSLDYGFNNLVVPSGELVECVNNFIQNGGKFVCWLSGDSHYDACGIYNGTAGKQLSLTFENASCEATWNDSDRVRGTATQDNFNFIAIDTTSNLIKCIRVGCNTDRYLRQKQFFVYDYFNHKIVSHG